MQNIIRSVLLALLCLRGCCCSLAVAQLPANDANKHQIIVVGMAGKAPVTWFDEIPELAKLKAGTAFTILRPKVSPESRDGLFETRYQTTLGTDYPIVAYCRPDGGVIYFADRHSMPEKTNLYAEIKAAHLRAKDAVPATAAPLISPNPYASVSSQVDDWQEESCLDGSCDTPLDDSSGARFPRLRPLRNPLDGGTTIHPIDRIVSGWFSDSITSGIFLVFSVVCLMVMILFAVLIFGAMIVVVRWVVK